MKRFYCNGKQDFCDGGVCPDDCEFFNSEGGSYIDDAVWRPPEKNKLKVVLDEGAIMPTRAHETDAGLDLYSMVDMEIPAECGGVFDTGVHVELPKNHVGFIKIRSSLLKQGLVTDGTIDCGYVGSIRVVLLNLTRYTQKIEAGQKIAQLVILPIITPELELVEALEDTERGTGGFGSTGKF